MEGIEKKLIVTKPQENAKLAADNKKKAKLLQEYIGWFEAGKVSFGKGWQIAKRGAKGIGIMHREAQNVTFKNPLYYDVGVSIPSTNVLYFVVICFTFSSVIMPFSWCIVDVTLPI